MQLHNVKRINKNKKRMTVARGGKRGKTAGRGTKGQKARSGHKIRPEIRDVIKRIPKMRGRGKNSNLTIQEEVVVVSLESISGAYKNGEIVSRTTLAEKGVISSRNGRLPDIKILGGAT